MSASYYGGTEALSLFSMIIHCAAAVPRVANSLHNEYDNSGTYGSFASFL